MGGGGGLWGARGGVKSMIGFLLSLTLCSSRYHNPRSLGENIINPGDSWAQWLPLFRGAELQCTSPHATVKTDTAIDQCTGARHRPNHLSFVGSFRCHLVALAAHHK